MRRVLGITAVAIVAFFVVAQLFRIDRTNPPVESDVPAPPDVKAALRAACYDCHSNETTWPWYSHVAPVSWLLAYDVKKGREELNYSTWQQYDARRQQKKMNETVETLNEGEMPPWYYLAIHRDARLADLQSILRWAQAGGGGHAAEAPPLATGR
jgi:hypothetical protein